MHIASHLVLLAIGATAVMDLWGFARPLIGWPAADYRMLGRWVGNMPRGRFRHASIARALPVRGENMLGWVAHYFTGIAFAAAFVGMAGAPWLEAPRLAPALLFGVATVAAPFLLMQPAMGAGIAAHRAPRPAQARLQSLITHAVFGLGLYLTARALAPLAS